MKIVLTKEEAIYLISLGLAHQESPVQLSEGFLVESGSFSAQGKVTLNLALSDESEEGQIGFGSGVVDDDSEEEED